MLNRPKENSAGVPAAWHVAVKRSQHLPWNAVYSRVSGDLPLTDVPQFTDFGGTARSVVRFRLQVTAAGA